MKNKISSIGMLSGVIAALYIALVACFMSFAETIFGPMGSPILGIMIFLMLFVFSAAFMFIAIFGKPLMMYLDGKKKEALALLAWSLGSLLMIGIVMALIIAITQHI